jgi:hypothetical protein
MSERDVIENSCAHSENSGPSKNATRACHNGKSGKSGFLEDYNLL